MIVTNFALQSHGGEEAEDDIRVQDMERLSEEDALYYQGLIFYCNRYQYDCEITYLQKYLEYINLEVDHSHPFPLLCHFPSELPPALPYLNFFPFPVLQKSPALQDI